MKPTRTTNRLHFSDLDPMRFEDLCLNLVYRHKPWLDIRHYGRTGNDGGVDIHTTEDLEDEPVSWYIQCRRYSSATKAMLIKAIDDVVNSGNRKPHSLLLIVACDVSRSAQDEFSSYAKLKGIERPMIWTGSVLEAQLYNEHPDILFTYFGVSKLKARNSRKTVIENKIKLKKKLWDVLVQPRFDPQKAMKCPATKFKSGYVLIRDIDDVTYPRSEDPPPNTISPWFKLQMYDFYHDGIECYLSGVGGLMHEDGRWAIEEATWQLQNSNAKEILVYIVGCIPYESIVTVDYEGDGIYPMPHLFCLFNHKGEPYESVKYILEGEYHSILDPARQVTNTTSD